MREIGVILICIITLSGCNKENGKHTYELRMTFDSGDVFAKSGKVYEKYRIGKKHDGTPYNFPLKGGKGNVFFADIFGGFQFLKMNDNRLVSSGYLNIGKADPTQFANQQNGSYEGQVYFERSYTQKGRAYTVEDGSFEFYWRNAEEFGMNDTILKGKWTLKRK